MVNSPKTFLASAFLIRFKIVRSSRKTFGPVEYFCLYRHRVSQKWRTNGAIRCRRDYRKREKNVKKIYWTYLVIWSLKVALNRSMISKYWVIQNDCG
jgi:hypothetical protein